MSSIKHIEYSGAPVKALFNGESLKIRSISINNAEATYTSANREITHTSYPRITGGYSGFFGDNVTYNIYSGQQFNSSVIYNHTGSVSGFAGTGLTYYEISGSSYQSGAFGVLESGISITGSPIYYVKESGFVERTINSDSNEMHDFISTERMSIVDRTEDRTGIENIKLDNVALSLGWETELPDGTPIQDASSEESLPGHKYINHFKISIKKPNSSNWQNVSEERVISGFYCTGSGASFDGPSSSTEFRRYFITGSASGFGGTQGPTGYYEGTGHRLFGDFTYVKIGSGSDEHWGIKESGYFSRQISKTYAKLSTGHIYGIIESGTELLHIKHTAQSKVLSTGLQQEAFSGSISGFDIKIQGWDKDGDTFSRTASLLIIPPTITNTSGQTKELVPIVSGGFVSIPIKTLSVNKIQVYASGGQQFSEFAHNSPNVIKMFSSGAGDESLDFYLTPNTIGASTDPSGYFFKVVAGDQYGDAQPAYVTGKTKTSAEISGFLVEEIDGADPSFRTSWASYDHYNKIHNTDLYSYSIQTFKTPLEINDQVILSDYPISISGITGFGHSLNEYFITGAPSGFAGATGLTGHVDGTGSAISGFLTYKVMDPAFVTGTGSADLGININGASSWPAMNGGYSEYGTLNSRKTYKQAGDGIYYLWYSLSATRWYISTVVGSTPGSNWVGSSVTSDTTPFDVSFGSIDITKNFNVYGILEYGFHKTYDVETQEISTLLFKNEDLQKVTYNIPGNPKNLINFKTKDLDMEQRSLGFVLYSFDERGSLIDRSIATGEIAAPSISGLSYDNSTSRQIDFLLNFSKDQVLKTEVYTGSYESFSINSNNLVAVLPSNEDSFVHFPPLNSGEPPISYKCDYYYKFLPYDNFGSGELFSTLATVQVPEVEAPSIISQTGFETTGINGLDLSEVFIKWTGDPRIDRYSIEISEQQHPEKLIKVVQDAHDPQLRFNIAQADEHTVRMSGYLDYPDRVYTDILSLSFTGNTFSDFKISKNLNLTSSEQKHFFINSSGFGLNSPAPHETTLQIGSGNSIVSKKSSPGQLTLVASDENDDAKEVLFTNHSGFGTNLTGSVNVSLGASNQITSDGGGNISFKSTGLAGEEKDLFSITSDTTLPSIFKSDMELYMESGVHGQTGYKLQFGSFNHNADPIFFSRYDVGSDSSQLRLYIGDNYGNSSDKFAIGAVAAGTTDFNADFQPILTVAAHGGVGINKSAPTKALEIEKSSNTDSIVKIENTNLYGGALEVATETSQANSSPALKINGDFYVGASGSIILDYSKLPISDPGVTGQIYRDTSNFLKISSGA